MKVVITGGAGFLGHRLAEKLLDRESLTGRSGGASAIEEIVLFDQVAAAVDDPRVHAVIGDVADAAALASVIDAATESVFHLAAMVSGGAEADFAGGYRANLDGTRAVLEACRALAHAPRVVFTSSIAVYGGALPATVDDDTPLAPQTSYGVAKAAGELLINDYSRKGFIDGRSLRLPPITVRPGRPNTAASSWCSDIVREPLSGVDTVCPVTPETRFVAMSPRRVMDAFLRAHEAPAKAFGEHRSVLLPGLSVSAAEMAEAVARRGEIRERGAIEWRPDPLIQRIMDGWPAAISAPRAARLGIEAGQSIDEIVESFIEDDLDAQIELAGEIKQEPAYP